MFNETEAENFEDTLKEFGLITATVVGYILTLYLLVLLLLLLRACVLWIYCKYYLKRPIVFELCPPDPWCFKDDFEAAVRRPTEFRMAFRVSVNRAGGGLQYIVETARCLDDAQSN